MPRNRTPRQIPTWKCESEVWLNESAEENTRATADVATSLYLLPGPPKLFSLATKDYFTLAERVPDPESPCPPNHVKAAGKSVGETIVVTPTGPYVAQLYARHMDVSVDDDTKRYVPGPESRKGNTLGHTAADVASALCDLKRKVPDLYPQAYGREPVVVQRTMSNWPDRSKSLTFALVASRVAKSSPSTQCDGQSTQRTGSRDCGKDTVVEADVVASAGEQSDDDSVHTLEADVEFWKS